MGGLSYPLLSDFWTHGLVYLKYNSLRKSGATERSIFFADTKGLIAYGDIHDINEQPPADKVLEALARFASPPTRYCLKDGTVPSLRIALSSS